MFGSLPIGGGSGGLSESQVQAIAQVEVGRAIKRQKLMSAGDDTIENGYKLITTGSLPLVLRTLRTGEGISLSTVTSPSDTVGSVVVSASEDLLAYVADPLLGFTLSADAVAPTEPARLEKKEKTLAFFIPRGYQGIQGDKGDEGEQGVQGIQGNQGDKGDQGEQGIQGLKGDTGLQGDKGDPGEPGADGPPGTDGTAGTVINSVTVTTLGPGSVATVSYTDDTTTPSPFDKKLTFGIPRGIQGTAGTSATVSTAEGGD